MGQKISSLDTLNYLGTEEQPYWKIFTLEDNQEIINNHKYWDSLLNFHYPSSNFTTYNSRLNSFLKNICFNIPPSNEKISASLQKLFNVIFDLNHKKDDSILIIDDQTDEFGKLLNFIYLLRHFIYASFYVNATDGFLIYLKDYSILSEFISVFLHYFNLNLQKIEYHLLFNEILMLLLILLCQKRDHILTKFFASLFNEKLKAMDSTIMVKSLLANIALLNAEKFKNNRHKGLVRRSLGRLIWMFGYPNESSSLDYDHFFDSLSINSSKFLMVLIRINGVKNNSIISCLNKLDVFTFDGKIDIFIDLFIIKSCNIQSNESLIILANLYELLLCNPMVCDAFAKSAILGRLIHVICQNLNVNNTHPPIKYKYLLLINLLLLSKSDHLIYSICDQKITLSKTDWLYNEMWRFGNSISCVDYLVNFLIIMIGKHSSNEKDQYIKTTCLAVLSNTSSFWKNLNQETYGRLINLVEYSCIILRKHNQNSSQTNNMHDFNEILSSTRVLVDSIVCCIKSDALHNVHLIYSLLLSKPSTLQTIKSYSQTYESFNSLYQITIYLSDKMKDIFNEDVQPEYIIEVIKSNVEHLLKLIKDIPSMKFNYFEDNEATEFFSSFITDDSLPFLA